MKTILKPKKRTKWTLVSLNQTEHWTDEAAQFCDRIMTVHLYDKNQHTYCCEVTLSYYLIPVYSYPVFKDSVINSSEYDEVREKVLDILLEGDAHESPSYYHIHDVDSIPSKYHKVLKGVNIAYFDTDGEDYRENENDIIDMLRSNQSSFEP